MMKIVMYIGDASACPPCRRFHDDLGKIMPVFEQHGIMFIDVGHEELPVGEKLFRSLMRRRDMVTSIPQYHFYEVDQDGEIEKYKSEVGYVGVFKFVNKVEEFFQLTNKESNMTDGSVMDPTKGSPGNPTANRRMTLGEMRVRVSFNPSSGQSGEYIDRIKKQSAELIDLIDGVASPKFNDDEFKEWVRLKELAITAIEEGAMWAVKSATV